jgi:hypothetical protein
MSRVNIIQLTVVHDIDQGTMTCTGAAPYITVPDDRAIVACRDLLLKEFGRVTEPATKDQASPVFGEWTEAPGEQAPAEIRTPAEKPLVLIPGGRA